MIRRQTYSFKNAFSGLLYVVRTQPNMLVHLLLSLFALLAGLVFELTVTELMIILVLITIGLCIEIINTAIELTIDSIHKDYHEKAKLAKDVSSAAMLLFAIFAVIIFSILFVPKIVVLL